MATGRRRPDQRDAVFGRGQLAEIDGDVLILEMRDGKGRLPDEVMQLRRTVREQAVAGRKRGAALAVQTDVR